MVTYKKSWVDQPDVVTTGQPVLSLSLDGRLCEVRSAPAGQYFITTGNIYGSQTVETRGMDTVLKVIQKIDTGKLTEVPEGATLLDNAKETDDGTTDQGDEE